MSASAPLPSAGPGSGTWAPPRCRLCGCSATAAPSRCSPRMPRCAGGARPSSTARRCAGTCSTRRAGRPPSDLAVRGRGRRPGRSQHHHAAARRHQRHRGPLLDRALWIARGWRPWTPRRHWKQTRDTVRDRVLAAIDEQGLLPRAYGQSPAVPDASSPMAVAFGLLGRKDARGHRLVDALLHRLGAGPYVYRYPPGGDDGFSGTEGAFLPTSFLAVTALAQLGRVDEAWTGSAPPSRAYWPRRSTRRPGRYSATHRCV